MPATMKPLLALTARDLMTCDVVRLPERMPLREAARLLLRNQVGGAPVVDTHGKCVGVLSVVDFLRLAEKRADVTAPAESGLPVNCTFQTRQRGPNGQEVVLCSLPAGMCPLQRKQTNLNGKDSVVCSQPDCVLVDWQTVDVEKLPSDEVSQFMTPDPVMVQPDTSIRTLSQMMVDAHIHRIIVVDERERPIGIVSSMDLLAALAASDDE